MIRLETGAVVIDRQGPASSSPAGFEPEPRFPFSALHDVNAQLVELLARASRAEAHPSFPLLRYLTPLFRSLTPENRRRVAQRNFLLVDMEFLDADWWKGVRLEPHRRWRTAGFHDAFPRRTGVPLARSTLVFAWHSIQADIDATCVLLGMSRAVADCIGSLQPSELDQIADRRHRHVLPRWHDRPAFWHELLTAARSKRAQDMRLVELHALQLLTGPLLAQSGLTGRT
jgi:hypothetical protein